MYRALVVVLCSVIQSCMTLLQPYELQPARLLCPWDSPGKNTGVGYHFLLQGIFLTQGLNLHLPRADFSLLSYQQSYVYSSCVLLCCVQSHLTLCEPTDYSPPGSSVHGDSPGKNPGVGFHALLQGTFPTQGLNPGLLHYRWNLYHLRYQGSLRILGGQPIPSPGDLPDPEIELGSPTLQVDFFKS